MKKFLYCAALIFFAGMASIAQTVTKSPLPEPQVTPTIAEPTISADQVKNQPKGSSAANASYVRPDAKTRSKRYINSLVGPFSLARQVAGAGYATWRNSPEEWGDSWEGFGRRVASNFGKNVIKQTTVYGLGEAFKLDSHYYRSKDRSVGARVTNALISPVTARNRNGKRVFGFPRIAGTYAGNIISREVWYPARFDWKDGLKSGTISLGYNAAFNLFKEFVWKK